MVQKRDIDHVVPDPSFEVREGRLKGLLQEAMGKASQKTMITRVCEISGSAALALILALLSVEKFKAIGPMTSENVQGGVFTLCMIACALVVISGIRILLNKHPLPTAEYYVSILKPVTDNTSRTVLLEVDQVKLPHKLSAEGSGFYGLLHYLVARQGASSRPDTIAYLSNELGSNDPHETVAAAIRAGLIIASGDTISATKNGVDHFTHIREEEARQAFYGRNTEDDRTIPSTIPLTAARTRLPASGEG